MDTPSSSRMVTERGNVKYAKLGRPGGADAIRQ